MTVAKSRPNPRRVLFVSGLQIHPPLSGGNLRSYALASALAHHGLDVFVYSMVGRKKDYLARRRSSVERWPAGIDEYVDRGPLGFLAQFGSYFVGLPPVWLTAYLRAACSSPRQVLLPGLLRERLEWCDAVVADFPFVHPAFGAPAARGRLRVVSTHNIEHHLYDDEARWQHRWTRDAVRRIELAAAAAADVVVACCEGDEAFFSTHASVRRSVLVPNGIDLRRFDGLAAQRAAGRAALGLPEDVKVFLFTASKFGPNREAFDFLQRFALENRATLEERRVHLAVVGNVVADPVRLPAFTATGRVDVVEPYFAAADAALNPIATGAGTNVKMCEFMAARLPIVTTPFGARGFRIEDERTGFLFERDALAPTLSKVSRLLEEDPGRLARIANEAYRLNERAIDMDVGVEPLVDAIVAGQR